MQRIILLLSMALLPLSFVNAQFAKNNALFLSSELTYGNYFGGGADLNYVLKDGYFGLLVPPFSVQMVPLTFLCLGLLKDHLQS